MKNNLIIFVDAYPWFYRNLIKNELPEDMNISSLKPTFGFSINQKALLFSGKYPDEIGYFNEWRVSEKSPSKTQKIISKILPFIPPKVEGFLHKLYNKIFGLNYYRIPFGMKEYWSRNPTEVYNRDSIDKSVFTEHNYSRILCSDFKVNNRDEAVFNELNNRIDNGDLAENTIVTLAECDQRLHLTGGLGKGGENVARYYANKIGEISRKYVSKYPLANLIVLSDHGMSNVNQGVNIQLEKMFTSCSYDTFLYFIDATMLRLWFYNSELQNKILTYLRNHNDLEEVTENTREQFKITNSSFGEFIFTVNSDTKVFEPNFYGRKRVNGMHGYIPKYESQLGVFISNLKNKTVAINAKEAFEIIKSCSDA